MSCLWDEFADALLEHDVRPAKERSDDPEKVLGFSLARFAPGRCTCGRKPYVDRLGKHRKGCPDLDNTGEPNGHRINANVIEVTALGIDLDANPGGSALSRADLDGYLARLESGGYECVVYSSHSFDGESKCSVRVIVQLSRPVPIADWSRFWPAAMGVVGVPNGCTPDARRFWYSPSAKERAPVLARRLRGKPLDVDAIMASIPPVEKREAMPRESQVADDMPTALRDWYSAIPVDFDETSVRYDILCPNAHEHTTPGDGAAVFGPKPGQDRKYTAHCFHAHCKGLKWADVRAENDPAYADRMLAANWEVGRPLSEGAVAEPAPCNENAPEQVIASPTARIARRACEILAANKPPRRIYSTGLPELDRLIDDGFKTRALHVVVARTGAGKSGFALGLAVVALRQHRLPVLYVSTELDNDEIVERLAAQIIGCSMKDVARGVVSKVQVIEAVGSLPFYTIGCDDIGRGPKALALIEAEARAIAAEHGVEPLVVVDYLQMLVGSADEKAVRMGTSEIANSLRGVSQRADCVLLAVSSTARAFYKGPGQKEDADDPLSYLASAKESGDVEFAAANLIYLDVDAEHTSGVYQARLVVAKSRWGTRGFVGARFEGPSGRWMTDKAAADAMSTQARARRGREQKEHEALTKVWQTIQGNPDQVWKTIRDSTGLSYKIADKAKAALILKGRIVEVKVSRMDTLGRDYAAKVLRVADTALQLIGDAPELPPIVQGSPVAAYARKAGAR